MIVKRTIFYLIPVGLVVLVALVFLRDSDEDRVLERIDALRALTEIREQQSTIKQATVARQIGNYFSEQTRFDLTGLGYRIIEIASRKELVQKILRGRATLTSLELGLDRPKVTVVGDGASVEVIGSALGSTRGEQGQFLDIHRVEITLRRLEGEWMITGGRHIRDERAPNRSTPDDPHILFPDSASISHLELISQ